MREETPLTRSSLVPVLGCVALMLFGLNFHQFVKKHADRLFQHWRACYGHHEVIVQRLVPNEHIEMHFFGFDHDQDDAQRELRHAERDLRRAERFLRDVERDLHQGGTVSASLQQTLARRTVEVAQERAKVAALRAQLLDRHEHRRHRHHHRHRDARCSKTRFRTENGH